jgi:hypothetical protein
VKRTGRHRRGTGDLPTGRGGFELAAARRVVNPTPLSREPRGRRRMQ